MLGVNPRTGEAVVAQRRRLALIEDLPSREAYAAWVARLVSGVEAAS
jgi:hypothetical protein